MEKMLTYLNTAISAFTTDPADTGFQHGYRAALMVMRDHVHDLIEEEQYANHPERSSEKAAREAGWKRYEAGDDVTPPSEEGEWWYAVNDPAGNWYASVEDLCRDEGIESDENVYQGADGFECYDIEVPLDTESLDDHPMSIAHRMERE